MIKRYSGMVVLAAKLKAKAARYRLLAETIFDPRLVAEVQACAHELDSEAALLERWPSFLEAA